MPVIDLTILIEPFMIRAIVAGLLVSTTTAIVGVYAVTRNAAFFANAIAHAALLGIALGVLFQISPLMVSLLVALIIASALPILEVRTKINIDTLLGLVMPISMALAVLILSLIPGYKPELMSFLFGNILAISWPTIYTMIAVTVVVLSAVKLRYKHLTAVAIDATFAKVAGLNTVLYTILHNALLTITIIPSLSMVGIILVSALVVIPAAIAKQLTASYKALMFLSTIISIIVTLGSIIISALANLPTGPVIVVSLGIVFALVSLSKSKHRLAL